VYTIGGGMNASNLLCGD